MENTDLINRLDKYWQYNKPNFIGILQNYDLSNLDDNLIEILIDKKVYIKRKMWSFEGWIEEYEVDREQYNAFGDIIAYSPYYYEINPLLIKETFLLVRNFIENQSYITEDFVLDLKFKANSKFNQKSKRKYLKKLYESYFPKDVEFASFSTLADNSKKLYGVHQAWYELFFDLVGSDSESFLGLYLTNSEGEITLETSIAKIVELAMEIDDEFKDFVEQWEIFYKAELILNEILFLIEETDAERHVIVDKTDSNSNCEEIVGNSNDVLSMKELSALEVAYYRYYMIEANESFEKSFTTLKEAYENLGSKCDVNSKNIQLSYNKISVDKELRTKANRWQMIEKTIPFLTAKARKIAQIELNMSKCNS
ncbi:MAG: hypothetical protein GYB35_15545 [Algicola sp.]|nr:hypothetical protein [Algicola sp.]